jgi:hypothetical protein
VSGSYGSRRDFTTSDFKNEGGRKGRGGQDLLRIDSALEAIGGIRCQKETTGAPADLRSGKISRFEEDLGSGISDSAVEPAHDSSESEGCARLVRDDAVDVLEGVGFFIEGFEFFVLGGLANVNSSIDLTSVEGMKRLTDFVEDIVCNINDVIDGTKANGFKFLYKPIRAWRDFDSFNTEDRIEWASRGIDGDDSESSASSVGCDFTIGLVSV